MRSLEQVGVLNGYLGLPAGHGPWPAVIVIHEWWGLDLQTQAVADRLAQIGYMAFAPDLFHGELAALGDRDKASALVQKFGPGAPRELGTALEALSGRPGCSGKLGSVGFCFGGRMALLLALERRLDAVCTFYGGGMQQIFDRLTSIQSPVLGLFGDRDASIPLGTIEQFKQILDSAGVEHEIVVYPGAGHAFFRDSDLSVYVPGAAKDAWHRLGQFFSQHLVGRP